MSSRKIIVTSFSIDKHLLTDIRNFLRYVDNIINKPKVKICYLGAANDNSWLQRKFFTLCVKLYNSQWMITEYLTNDVDMVFVAGGNTAKLVELYKSTSFDKTLKDAYNNGVVMTGVSAGLLCWMKEGLSDSYENLQKIDCLGFLPYSANPHANIRGDLYKQLVNDQRMIPGYSIPDGSIVYFNNEEISNVLNNRNEVEYVF